MYAVFKHAINFTKYISINNNDRIGFGYFCNKKNI